MIKVHGLGRRRDGMSHADCVRHHRETHSKLGVNQLEPMSKYILFYFTEAMTGTGETVTDLPWDMTALEWMEDERWNNFLTWLDKGTDGQEIKTDEANFLARERCYLCAYDENIVIGGAPDRDHINVLRFIKAKAGVPARDAIARHKLTSVPIIKRDIGPWLGGFTANYIVEPTSLVGGKIPVSPVDIVEIYRISPAAIDKLGNVSGLFGSPELVGAEAEIAEPAETIVYLADEAAYIP